jgi:hypothetical protein
MSVLNLQRLLSMRMRTFKLERHLESTVFALAMSFLISGLSPTQVRQLPQTHGYSECPLLVIFTHDYGTWYITPQDEQDVTKRSKALHIVCEN